MMGALGVGGGGLKFHSLPPSCTFLNGTALNLTCSTHDVEHLVQDVQWKLHVLSTASDVNLSVSLNCRKRCLLRTWTSYCATRNKCANKIM